MFIAIVQIPGLERSKAEAIESAQKSAPHFATMKGLLRKYYLTGANGGGGVYIWESREAAEEALYKEGWADDIEKRFGIRPKLTYYDNYVVLDNVTGTLAVEGNTVRTGE